MKVKEIAGNLSAKGIKLAIVVSRFNSFFTEQLLKGALDCIERHDGADAEVTIVRVPGANEIALAVEKLASSGSVDAIIALGAVIQGATPHADLINSQVARAIAQASVKHSLPVVNSVVCANSLDQAIERSGTKAGNKGWDGAATAIEMVAVSRAL